MCATLTAILEDCTVSESPYATVEGKDFGMFVMNPYAPKGEGVNEVFHPIGSTTEPIHFLIYDRLGEQIFYAQDINTLWDDTYNGAPPKQDV